MAHTEAARKCLQTSLEKSAAIASALDESGSRLELLNQRFESLEDATSVQKCSLYDIGDHIDTVLCSAAAVLKVFEAVRELEESLLAHPTSDLRTYISNTKKLEEALKLLTDNSRLVLGWLQGVFDFLRDKKITNERCVFNVSKSLRILQELNVMEGGARGDGGLLTSAFDRLETEFHRLLMENTLPLSVTHKLQAIVERLHAYDRLDKCTSIYVEVRGMTARKCAESLDLSYLEMQFEDLHVIGSYIDQWGQHLELAVKHLLEIEYKLCSNVFDKIGQETRMECFAKVAIETGILSFLKFGSKVAASKNDPIKLLKLLDIFRVLDGLRLKFNQLFNGKACEEIRIVTKDLVNEVVNGVGEIFWQLPAQVKLLRPSSPPTDGSVPRVVSFVTDYCNQLLGDAYRPHLTQVLKIHISWRKEVYEEGIVFTQIYNIIKEIAVNLDAWSKGYEEITLSCLFMMNNHCHFYNLRGTALGNLMGDSWLRAHEQYRDYYAALYLRNSWENLVPMLIVRKDLLSPSVTGQDFAHRLNAFNVAFEERYKKQSNWAISDEVLRENICKHLVEGIVPTYRAYVKNYSLSIENDAKHIKYSAHILENMIRSLFQPKLSKYGKIKQADLISKLKHASKQFHSTLNAQ